MTEDGVAYDALIQFLYQAPVGLLRLEMDGEIILINPMAAALLMPLAPAGALVNLFDVLAPLAPDLRARAMAHAEVGSAVGGGTVRIPVANASAVPDAGESRARPSVLGLRLVRFDAGTWMATLSDITQSVRDEQRALTDRLRAASRLDGLTELPSREVIVEHIERAHAAAPGSDGVQFGILFIDIDRFQRVNATRGLAAGDLLLQSVADRLRRLVEPEGALERLGLRGPVAGRLGADEFVIVAPEVHDAQTLAEAARQLVGALSEPYVIHRRAEHASASVGVLLVRPDPTTVDPESLLQDASIAMSDAKAAGGARYSLFEPGMKARMARRAAIESDLRGALMRAELSVAYQPIVALPGRRCVGMEALVRWQHPTLGAVPPQEFVAIAEEVGLIQALGRFVLFEACGAFAAWRHRFGDAAPASMSVNVSRAQLADRQFAGHVQEALRSTGMQASELQLEVTESMAAQDGVVQQALQTLRRMGLSIALDDFGTGYSSLATLHLLPIDVLKIDRSFVMQVETSLHHRVLIEAVILVARSLGMRTVAEGIETEGQAAAVAALNCDKGQGYLYSRPMPQDAATAWLEAHRAVDAV